MSRISSGVSPTNPNRGFTDPTSQRPYNPEADPNNEKFVSDISARVKESPAYKQAYELFSRESDKSWLQRLEMIPYSVDDPNTGFFYEIGITTDYDKQQNANYQYCMEQINALVAEYQSWKNSLPVEQVEQLNRAGINAAVTGQGVHSSDIPNVGVSTNPSSVITASASDIFSSIGQFVGSVSGGLLSWVQLYDNIRQFNVTDKNTKESLAISRLLAEHTMNMDADAKKRAYADFNLKLAEFGISPITDDQDIYEHAINIGDSGYSESNAEAQAIRGRKLAFENASTPVLSDSIASEIQNISLRKFEIFKYQMQLEELSAKRNIAEQNYSLGYYGESPDAFGKDIASYDKSVQQIESNIKKAKWSYMEYLSKQAEKGDTVCSLILNHMLDGLSPSEVLDFQVLGDLGPRGAKLLDFLSDKL